jgi:membrane fusion protein, multidrug efflux system
VLFGVPESLRRAIFFSIFLISLMLTKRLFLFVLFVFSLAFAANRAQAANDAIPVTLTPALMRDVAVIVEAPGALESLAQPHIAAEIAARILALYADEGAPVKQGQTLAELDAEPYRLTLQQAEAEQGRVQAQIKNQQLTLARFRNLLKQNSSAQSEVDKAATDLAVLQAELAGAQARIAEARYRLSKTTISSPVTGAVQQRLVSVGDYVQPGMPLFQVVALNPLRARLYFPENLADQIQPGQIARLHLPGQTQTIEAAISTLRPMLNPANRGLEALVELPNPGHWKPGYSVTASITLDTHPKRVMLPEAALVRRPVGTVVYRVVDGKAQAQVVETGLRDNGLVEIRLGLAAGEEIVLDGAGFLSDGAAVAVKK